MTLPMIVLPRPAPSSERATPSAQGSSHDAVPGAADGATDFAELLGAAVRAGDRSGTATPQAPPPTPPSVSATAAADAPADPPDQETIAPTGAMPDLTLAEQAEHTDDDPSGDRPKSPLPAPAAAVPADIAPALAVSEVAGHQATGATGDSTTGGRFVGDDDLPLAGPPAVRPGPRPDVRAPSTTAPVIEQDTAVDNTEPWAFAVSDRPAGASDRPSGPTLTLPATQPPTGSAAGATLDSFPTPTSAAEPANTGDLVDVTAVTDAVDLTDTALRELQRGELQRIGSSRLGIDVATTTLGNIRIEALERGGELQLRLGADQVGARALLTERLPELREHLRAEGVDVGNVDVSSGHDRTRGDRDRRAAPSNLTPTDTDRASGDPPPGTALRVLAPSVMSAAGRVDVRI